MFPVKLMGKVHLIHDTRPLSSCLHMIAMTTPEGRNPNTILYAQFGKKCLDITMATCYNTKLC